MVDDNEMGKSTFESTDVWHVYIYISISLICKHSAETATVSFFYLTCTSFREE